MHTKLGTWYLQRSQLGSTGIQFGDAYDKPVLSDYDGDGKADVVVFRPSNGVWYLQQNPVIFTGVLFGISTDLPTPADYDGDGKTDIAVFRGDTWYLNCSGDVLIFSTLYITSIGERFFVSLKINDLF